MSHEVSSQTIATLGIDVGKNVFHLIGLNRRGAVLLRQKLTRRQLAVRLSNCRLAWSAWKPASERIIWDGRSRK